MDNNNKRNVTINLIEESTSVTSESLASVTSSDPVSIQVISTPVQEGSVTSSTSTSPPPKKSPPKPPAPVTSTSISSPGPGTSTSTSSPGPKKSPPKPPAPVHKCMVVDFQIQNIKKNYNALTNDEYFEIKQKASDMGVEKEIIDDCIIKKFPSFTIPVESASVPSVPVKAELSGVAEEVLAAFNDLKYDKVTNTLINFLISHNIVTQPFKLGIRTTFFGPKNNKNLFLQLLFEGADYKNISSTNNAFYFVKII